MSPEVLVTNLIQAFNLKDVEMILALLDPAFHSADVTMETTVTGLQEASVGIRLLFSTFPDARLTCHALEHGKKSCVVFWSLDATHLGTFRRIPPTGKRILAHGTSVISMENELIVRVLHLWDQAALLRSMQLLPRQSRRSSTHGDHTMTEFFGRRESA